MRSSRKSLVSLVVMGALIGPIVTVSWSSREQEPDGFAGLWTRDTHYGIPLVYGVRASDIAVDSHWDIVNSCVRLAIDAAVGALAGVGLAALGWAVIRRHGRPGTSG